MITEEMRSKWREEFKASFPIGNTNVAGHINMLQLGSYLAAKEFSQKEINELKSFIENECGEPYENLTTKTDARSMVRLHMEQANEYFHKQLDERDELIKEAVVYIETIRAINNLPGYRINDGEKQFKDWLTKAKAILGEK